MAAPLGSAKELDEDAGREVGLPTPGGKWDEGEQGPGGIGELEEENGVGGRAKDTRARRGAGIATKGTVTETLALGLQGRRGTEGITPSGRNGARKSIQRLVIGRSETSAELWKATRS